MPKYRNGSNAVATAVIKGTKKDPLLGGPLRLFIATILAKNLLHFIRHGTVIAGDVMAVYFESDCRVGVPQPAGYLCDRDSRSEQLGCVGVPKRMEFAVRDACVLLHLRPVVAHHVAAYRVTAALPKNILIIDINTRNFAVFKI